MQFAYQARDQKGNIREGEIAAATLDEATRQLRQEGLYLLRVEEHLQEATNRLSNLFQKRVKRSDIMYLTNQLAVLTDSGVPVAEALEGLAEQSVNPTLAQILQEIQRSVESGEDLSAALARHPRYFDRTFVNLVKASEASGTLSTMLERIAIQMRSELETRQKVLGAMMYPASMIVMCVGVSIFLLVYVFPKLTPMFATKQMAIPKPTLVLMAVSDALIGYWYLFVAGFGAVTGGFLYSIRQPWGRRIMDWFWLHCPLIGPLLRKVALGRCLRTLAGSINAGVPVLDAIELSGSVAGNTYYEQLWTRVGEQVTTGRQIHETLSNTELIPGTVRQMIASGEATGRLGDILNKVSDYYDTEIKNTIKSTTSLIEPIMVFVMGGVIGSLALAMLLPIFRLSGSPH